MSQFSPPNTTRLWLKVLGFALIGVALGTAVGWQIVSAPFCRTAPTPTTLHPSPTNEPPIPQQMGNCQRH